MFRPSRFSWWLVSTLMIVALLATACGGAASKPPSAAPGPGAPSGAAPTAAPGGGAAPAATPSAPAAAAPVVASPAGAAPSNEQFAGTILVGVSTSQTGSLAKEGTLTLNGATLAVEAYNQAGGVNVGGKRYKLELKVYDDESKSDTTVKLVDKLITSDKVNFLLSPYSSGQVQAASPLSEKYKIIMMDDGGAADSLFQRGFKYLFAPQVLGSHYLYSTVDLALAQGIKKIALLGANDVFSALALKSADAYAKSKGAEVVYDQTYPPTAKDLSTNLAAIKQTQPEALLGSGHFEDALLAVRQSKQQDLTVKMMSFTVGPSTPDFIQALGKDANGIVGPVPWSPQMKTNGDDPFKTAAHYAQVYQARFKQEPDYHSAVGSVCIVALVKGIEAAGSIDTEKVREALTKLDAQTFWGQVKFDQHGVTSDHQMVIEQIQNDKHVLVWPQDVAVGKLEYPLPAWSQR